MLRPFRLLPLVLALATLTLASGPPSAGADDVITFEPSHPTWHDALTIRVETFDLGCGLARLTEPEFRRENLGGEVGWVIAVEIEDGCAVGIPSPRPVTLTTVVDPIAPGSGEYLVRVSRPETGHVVEKSIVVYDPADERILLPRPILAGETFLFSAEFFAPCPRMSPEPLPEEHVLLVRMTLFECEILPPSPTVKVWNEFVGPLEPGWWEAVLLDEDENQVVRERFFVYDPEGCVPSDTTLCLHDGRFAVEATWKDFEGETGVAHALPLEDLSDSGLMWFFRDTNVELTVKVLRGCELTDSWWVSLASTSDVEFEVSVTDTRTLETRTYRNELGDRFVPRQGVFAFSCP